MTIKNLLIANGGEIGIRIARSAAEMGIRCHAVFSEVDVSADHVRKAYGLGSQGMVGGSFHQPMFAVAWPKAEFAPMNLEGAVKLGFRKELEAIADPAQRKAAFDAMVAEAYERGKALNAATLFEIDDVIDPAETRPWIMAGLRTLPPTQPRTGKKRPYQDTW